MEYVVVIIAIITMLITAIALWVTVSNFRKQLQLSFFADYTKRYQEIILNFPERINEKDFEISKLKSKERDKTLRYMRAYFDLCSEEYYLWKKGNLDNNTWKEWESGIKFAFSKPAFQQAWSTLTFDTIYYGEFSAFVNNAIGESNNKTQNETL